MGDQAPADGGYAWVITFGTFYAGDVTRYYPPQTENLHSLSAFLNCAVNVCACVCVCVCVCARARVCVCV